MPDPILNLALNLSGLAVYPAYSMLFYPKTNQILEVRSVEFEGSVVKLKKDKDSPSDMDGYICMLTTNLNPDVPSNPKLNPKLNPKPLRQK